MHFKVFNTTYYRILRVGVGQESQNKVEFGQPQWMGLVLVELPLSTFISHINLMKKQFINLNHIVFH